MSMTQHDEKCTEYDDMRGKCETCTVEFLEWQADGLLAMLEGLTDRLEEREEGN